MAETLITLVIIGVIAALTIPGLVQNTENKQLQSALKKNFSALNQMLSKAQVEFGYTPRCFYWDSDNPYGAICQTKDIYGNCLKYVMPDGSAVPSDKNGATVDCNKLWEYIQKSMTVVKYCANGYSEGCMPAYKGLDTTLQANNSGLSDTDAKGQTGGCGSFHETNLRRLPTYVLADGTILFQYKNYPIFAVDVNGKKGPNKWGYDLFSFQIRGNHAGSDFVATGGCYAVAKGGKTSADMMYGK